MSSSPLLQQCLACFVCLSLMVCVIAGKCLYSCFFEECCFQDLFRAARSILVQLPSSLFSRRLVNVYMVFPCSSTDTAMAWKSSLFSLSYIYIYIYIYMYPPASCQWYLGISKWSQISILIQCYFMLGLMYIDVENLYLYFILLPF